MKFYLVILSVACLSCLVPTALGNSFHASVLGGLPTPGSLLRGAKAAIRTSAMLAAQGLAARTITGASVITKPVVEAHVPPKTIVLRPPQINLILNHILRLTQTVKKPVIVAQKVVHRHETVVSPSFHFHAPEVLSPAFYEEHNVVVPCDPEPEIIVPPQIHEHTVLVPPVHHYKPQIIVPAVHVAPTPPSVAIIGPTMNVYQHPVNNAYSG